MDSKALVSRGPFREGRWAIEDVRLLLLLPGGGGGGEGRPLRDDEAVVEVVASGVCHTDLHCGDTPADRGVPGVYYPRVLGHEGAGYVRQVGKAVTHVNPGDAVLLSYSYCGECHVCKSGTPSHCTKSFDINLMGEPIFYPSSSSSSSFSSSAPVVDDESPEPGPPTIGGRYFGQSSFARHTIASARSLVNVTPLALSPSDLKLLAPLGCGLQTGAGTVLNVARAGPDDVVAVAGLGSVGLAAVMAAANLAGCRTIIGVDRVAARLELARSLGATHVVDSSGMTTEELVRAVRDASSSSSGGDNEDEKLGATVSIDTTGHPPLVAAQVAYTRALGQVIQVGTGMPDAHLPLHMQSFMNSGKQYLGAVMGHSRAGEFIPQLVRWWREGRFPLEKLVRFFPFEDYEEALQAMGRGDVVKPILVW